MTPVEMLLELEDRGVQITLVGDSLSVDAPHGVLSEDDVQQLRDRKTDLVRLLRLAAGLTVDDEAAELLDCDEVDPDMVPVCESCGRYCDVETLDEIWICSRCDSEATTRKQRTLRILSRASQSRRSIVPPIDEISDPVGDERPEGIGDEKIEK